MSKNRAYPAPLEEPLFEGSPHPSSSSSHAQPSPLLLHGPGPVGHDLLPALTFRCAGMVGVALGSGTCKFLQASAWA